MALVEHDANHHQRRVKFFQSLLDAVEKYCVVQPAYGELDATGALPRLVEVLQDEEMEVLLLARAHDAIVLTLDGRLRFVLEVIAKVPGVWPQVVLMHCARKNLIAPAKLAYATVRQFLSNRSFVSLGSADLTWMVMQGGPYLQYGMRRFKSHLSGDETDFKSVVAVAFEFLTRIAGLRIHLSAFGELFEHVVEGALRHQGCPPVFAQQVSDFVVELTKNLNGGAHPYPRANAAREQRLLMQRRHLAERFVRAQQLAARPATSRPVAVRVLFCSEPPWLVEDKSSASGDSTSEALPAATGLATDRVEPTSQDTPSDNGTKGKAYLVAAPYSGRPRL